MKQPNFSDATAYREWIQNHYPKQVALLLCEAASPAKTDWRDNHRAETIEQLTGRATVAFRSACRLMEKAEELAKLGAGRDWRLHDEPMGQNHRRT
jgi:hypothetical protein